MSRQEEQLRDEVAILAYQAGHPGGLEELVRRWQKRIFAYVAMTIGDDEAAWDISQQVWLGIVDGVARRRRIACFAAWAYGIAHNCCVNYFREKGRLREIEQDETPAGWQPDAAGPGISEPTLTAEDAAFVRACIASLPVAQREAISLFYLDQLSTDEMARVLGVSTGTVRSRLHYGRQRLKDMLLRKGYSI